MLLFEKLFNGPTQAAHPGIPQRKTHPEDKATHRNYSCLCVELPAKPKAYSCLCIELPAKSKAAAAATETEDPERNEDQRKPGDPEQAVELSPTAASSRGMKDLLTPSTNKKNSEVFLKLYYIL